MNRMNWIAIIAFALATAPTQAQGYQGGPSGRGLLGPGGGRMGPGIMGGGPAGVGMMGGGPAGFGVMGGGPAGIGGMGGPTVNPNWPFGGSPNRGSIIGGPGVDINMGPGFPGGGMSGLGMIGGPRVGPQPPFGGFQGGGVIGRPGAPNPGVTPGGPGWKPPNVPDIKAPPLNPDILKQLNPKIDLSPFSYPKSGTQASDRKPSEWPAWASWESAVGLFVVCVVIGLLFGRFGKPA